MAHQSRADTDVSTKTWMDRPETKWSRSSFLWSACFIHIYCDCLIINIMSKSYHASALRAPTFFDKITKASCQKFLLWRGISGSWFKSKSLIESYIHKSLYIDNSRVKISLLSERQADTSAKIWLKFLNMYTIRERKILYYEDKDHMFLGCLFTEQRCLHLPIDLAFFEIAENKETL